jgi:diaminopimelate decarboxylase
MVGKERIDDCLSTRNGHLFIEALDTVEIVERFGSPVFVVSEDQLRRNIRRFQKGFEAGWTDGPVKVMPAAKASWSSAVQKIIASEGCGCDIYSAGELAVALRSGFDPQYISVNGVPKDSDHIFNSVKQGARITIDGMEEFDIIEQAARELGTKAKVRLRMKPVLKGFTTSSDFVPSGPLSTDLAALAYKGGLPRDAVIHIGKRILKSPHVELVGFHEHHGRHHPSARYWEEQMKSYAEEIAIVSKALGGYQPGEIDIGGGFACPRDPFGSEIKYSEPYEFLVLYGLSKILSPFPDLRYRIISKIIDKAILFTPNQKMAPGIEEYGAVCTRTLKRELGRRGINTKGVMLQLEPGRSLHGNTGIHLTRVRSIKRMTEPISWSHAALDTTEFWFTGGRYEHHVFDYIFANKTGSPLVDKMDVVGRSCYGDRMFPTIKVPRDIEPGDIMAILDVGAYQEVSMSNFNAMPRPATLLVTGDRISVIRRAETQEDVFKRDEVPEHLAAIKGKTVSL